MARMAIEPGSPLFALRLLAADRLELRLPDEDEIEALIDVARKGIHPPDRMPFSIPWTDLEGEAFERGFRAYHERARRDWLPERWALELAVFVDGEPAGFQGLVGREFAALRSVSTGSWLGAGYQGRGIGKAMRVAVLTLAFDGLGAEEATTEALLDNHASAGVSRALGYAENGIGRLAPRGVAQETQRFRMTRAGWYARSRPRLEIVGLDACRGLFGVQDPRVGGSEGS